MRPNDEDESKISKSVFFSLLVCSDETAVQSNED